MFETETSQTANKLEFNVHIYLSDKDSAWKTKYTVQLRKILFENVFG